MQITKVYCEWDLGVNDLYTTEELARSVCGKAFDNLCIGMSIEEAEEEGLITFDVTWVEEEDEECYESP